MVIEKIVKLQLPTSRSLPFPSAILGRAMERRRCCRPVAWFWLLASLYFAQACNRIQQSMTQLTQVKWFDTGTISFPFLPHQHHHSYLQCRLIDIPPASDEDDIRYIHQTCSTISHCYRIYRRNYTTILLSLLGIFHEPRDRVSGLGSLYSRGKQHEVICCRITLYIWFASAIVGLGLGGYFVLHGHEKLKEWCMIMVGRQWRRRMFSVVSDSMVCRFHLAWMSVRITIHVLCRQDCSSTLSGEFRVFNSKQLGLGHWMLFTCLKIFP